MLTIKELYSLDKTLLKTYLEQFTYPWEALEGLGKAIEALFPQLAKLGYQEISPNVWAHTTAKIAPTALLQAPCIVGEHAEVRHGAFVRGNACIGANCVVGNSVELKNAILFDSVQVPHYNYVGDSILGYKAHMGAGSITSNVKSDKTEVVIHGTEPMPTHRKKVGAMLGDFVEVGCNSVLNPGTVVGKNSNIYPLSCVRGVVAPNSIFKNAHCIVQKEEK